MKKGLVYLVIAMTILGLFLTFGGEKLILNSIGHIMHFGACPNCGDSWFWKESGSISYTNNSIEKVLENIKPDTAVLVINKGVMICKECLKHRKRLNPEKIERDLIKSGWKINDVAMVKKAIENYKMVK